MIRALGADPDRMDRRTWRDLQYGWMGGAMRGRWRGRWRGWGTSTSLRRWPPTWGGGAGWPYQVLVGDRDSLFPRATLEPALARLGPEVQAVQALQALQALQWMRNFGHVPFLQDGPRFQAYWERALAALYPAGSPA